MVAPKGAPKEASNDLPRRKGSLKLVGDEEAWREVIVSILNRFPDVLPQRVVAAMRETKGHGGRAVQSIRRDLAPRIPTPPAPVGPVENLRAVGFAAVQFD